MKIERFNLKRNFFVVKYLLFTVIHTLSTQSFCAVTSTDQHTSENRKKQKILSKIITLNFCQGWGNPGNNQTFYLQPDLEKAYIAQGGVHTWSSGGIFVGLQTPLNSKITGQLGLAVAALNNASLTGDVWEDADPNFNNFTYQYTVRHVRLALKNVWLLNVEGVVTPYVNASVGLAFNRAYDFTIHPTIFEEISAPAFGNHSRTSLTYSFGVGVQKMLTTHWLIGVGYSFTDWGKSALSKATGQTLNSGLSLSRFYVQELQVTLGYQL